MRHMPGFGGMSEYRRLSPDTAEYFLDRIRSDLDDAIAAMEG